MAVEDKYLDEKQWGDMSVDDRERQRQNDADKNGTVGKGIPGYKQTHPLICMSCGNRSGNLTIMKCKAFNNVDVLPYGTCPKHKKVYA